jgi:hypothetical protein
LRYRDVELRFMIRVSARVHRRPVQTDEDEDSDVDGAGVIVGAVSLWFGLRPQGFADLPSDWAREFSAFVAILSSPIVAGFLRLVNVGISVVAMALSRCSLASFGRDKPRRESSRITAVLAISSLLGSS